MPIRIHPRFEHPAIDDSLAEEPHKHQRLNSEYRHMQVHKVSITPHSGESALNFALHGQTDKKFLSTPVRLPEICSALWHLSKHKD